MTRLAKILVSLLSGLFLLGIGGYFVLTTYYLTEYADFNTAPNELQANLPPFKTQTSQLGLNLKVTTKELERAFAHHLPWTLKEDSDREEVGCIEIRAPRVCDPWGNNCIGGNLINRQCLHALYDYKVQRGDISISAGNGRLSVTVPVQLSGGIGFNGYLAHLLSIRRKSFRGQTTLTASGTPVLDKNYCLKIQNARANINPDASLNIELIGRNSFPGGSVGPAWVDLYPLIEGDVKKALSDAMKHANSNLPCFKKEVAQQSKPQLIALGEIDGIGLSAAIAPQKVKASDLRLHNNLIEVGLGVDFKATLGLSSQLKKPSATPLPPLQKAQLKPGINLRVPLRASYTVLSEKISQVIVGQSYNQGQLEILLARVFPTDQGRLAIELGLKVDPPTRLIDTQGKVWLVARPVIQNGTKLALTEISLHGALDNQLTQGTAALVSALLQKKIQDKIAQAAQLDLTEQRDTALRQVRQSIVGFNQDAGLSAKLDRTSLHLVQLVLTPKDIVIEAQFTGQLQANLKTR